MKRALVFLVLVVSGAAVASGQYLPPPPRTPVIDTMATDWRGKVNELERRQAVIEQQLSELRRQMGTLGGSLTENQQELTRRMSSLEKMHEATLVEMAASREVMPSWLPALLDQQDKKLQDLRAEELSSANNQPKASNATTVLVKAPVTSTINLRLACGCNGELTHDGVQWWLLERHHRGKTIKRRLDELAEARSNYRVLATTADGYQLTVDSAGSHYVMLTPR